MGTRKCSKIDLQTKSHQPLGRQVVLNNRDTPQSASIYLASLHHIFPHLLGCSFIHSLFISFISLPFFSFHFIFIQVIPFNSKNSKKPSPGRVYPSPLPPSRRFIQGGLASPETQNNAFFYIPIFYIFLSVILMILVPFLGAFRGPF